MIRWRVLRQVTRLTFREFMRTPSAVFWTYGFPLLMTVVIGLAFRSDPPTLPVAVVKSEFSAAQFDALQANSRLEPKLLDRAAAEEEFQHGTVLLIVSGDPEHTRIKLDRKRPDAELARLQVEHTLQERRTFEILQETTPGRRYIDWLIPGLIGLNLLGAGLWGVGYNLVQMRVKNILRRLMVTPMYRSEFMLAFLLSRLSLVIPEAALILGFSKLMFDVPIAGSLWTIVLIVLLGGLSFTGLGLLIASRPRTVETVSGLMNLNVRPEQRPLRGDQSVRRSGPTGPYPHHVREDTVVATGGRRHRAAPSDLIIRYSPLTGANPIRQPLKGAGNQWLTIRT